MKTNYDFFMKTDLSNFIGEWVAIYNQRIISSGKSAKQVFREARKKHPKARILLTKVPEKETMIF